MNKQTISMKPDLKDCEVPFHELAICASDGGEIKPNPVRQRRERERLVKFMEILMQIDQRQKNNQKSHRDLDSTS